MTRVSVMYFLLRRKLDFAVKFPHFSCNAFLKVLFIIFSSSIKRLFGFSIEVTVKVLLLGLEIPPKSLPKQLLAHLITFSLAFLAFSF